MMMKWLCILLLIINISYFGWVLDRHTSETLRVHGQALQVPAGVPGLYLLKELEQPPQKRVAVAPPPAVPARDDAEAEVLTEIDETLGLVTSLPGISTTVPEALLMPSGLAIDACFSFGPFTEGQIAAQFHDWLEHRRTPAKLRRDTGQDKQLFQVYLAPRAGAEATLQQLRAQGVQDVSLIRTGTLQNAVSLGLFSTQAAVNSRLRELQDKGYQPIVVPYNEETEVYWVDARISRSDIIDDIQKQFPAGLNYLPVRCEEIASPGAAQ
jgi:hypothetical protein